MKDINSIINEINSEFSYGYDKELKITRSKYCDELRSVSVISNIEKINYDSSLSKEELEVIGNENKDKFVKKEFQKFGDDVHKITELAFDSSETKDSISQMMTSIQGKLDFEHMYSKIFGNMEAMCVHLNLDKDSFFAELKVTDGYNHGKFDLVVKTKNDEYIIIDYKTSKNLGINYMLQINIYRKILSDIYKIDTVSEFLIKIDKDTYDFSYHKVPIIDNKYIDELLRTGELSEQLTKECIEMYSDFESEHEIKTISIDLNQEELVSKILDYNAMLESLSIKKKEKFSEYKNVDKEIAEINVIVQDCLNKIVENEDFDSIAEETQVADTNLHIVKLNKANGNSAKFKDEYNTNEAIKDFCFENKEDFFNRATDMRSFKSYIWKNYEELRAPKWVLSYKIMEEQELEDEY